MQLAGGEKNRELPAQMTEKIKAMKGITHITCCNSCICFVKNDKKIAVVKDRYWYYKEFGTIVEWNNIENVYGRGFNITAVDNNGRMNAAGFGHGGQLSFDKFKGVQFVTAGNRTMTIFRKDTAYLIADKSIRDKLKNKRIIATSEGYKYLLVRYIDGTCQAIATD